MSWYKPPRKRRLTPHRLAGLLAFDEEVEGGCSGHSLAVAIWQRGVCRGQRQAGVLETAPLTC